MDSETIQTAINTRRARRRRPYPPLPDQLIPVGSVLRYVLDATEHYPSLRKAFHYRLLELVICSPDWREMQQRAWELLNDFDDALGGLSSTDKDSNVTIDRSRDRVLVKLSDYID